MNKLILKAGDKFVVTSALDVENWNSTMDRMKGKEVTIKRINIESFDIEEMGYYWVPRNGHVDFASTLVLHGITLETNDPIMKDVLNIIESFKGEKVKNEFASKWSNVEFKYKILRQDGDNVFEISW